MEGIDLDETNRIRQALGLKPIGAPAESSNLVFQDGKSGDSGDGPDTTLDDRHAAAYDNWQQLEQKKQEDERRKRRNLEIKKQRDAALRFAKLEGKGLGDLDEGEDLEDTKNWLLKSRKRRKQIETERAERMAKELEEREKLVQNYTSADLAGLKVGHQLDQFEAEGEQVLTLKDVKVGGDESEEDELENLELRAKEKLEKNLRNKKRKMAYDPNAVDDDTAILGHYDEDISGPKKAQFSLDAIGRSAPDVDMKPAAPTFQLYEEVYDKKREKRRSRAKALAEQLQKTKEETIEDEEVGLVIDETSEFVSALKAANSEAGSRKRPKIELAASKAEGDEAAMLLEAMGQDPLTAAAAAASESATTSDVEPTEPSSSSAAPALFAEEAIQTGLGSTLKMLTSRGLLQKSDADRRNDMYRERQKFLALKHTQETEAERRARKQREDDRNSGKFDRMTAREKEAYSQNVNAQRDLVEARRLAEEFDRNYKPDIELKYVDEYGQVMSNPKDAFKHLSHIFHGKGSGNKKTEKKLKKMADEKKKESQSLMDSSRDTGSMDSAAVNRAKNSRQAGVRFA